MLSVLMFHIIDEKDIMANLRQELATVMPKPDSKPNWTQLEQLPYLVSPLNANQVALIQYRSR